MHPLNILEATELYALNCVVYEAIGKKRIKKILAEGAANTREEAHGPGSALRTVGSRWPGEGTVLTHPAGAAAEQRLQGRLAGPRQRYLWIAGWALAAAGPGRPHKGDNKLLCQLLELKVTGQPKVTRVELKDEAT